MSARVSHSAGMTATPVISMRTAPTNTATPRPVRAIQLRWGPFSTTATATAPV